MHLTRRRFIETGLTLATCYLLKSSVQPFSILSPSYAFAGQFYDSYNAQFLANAPPEFRRLLGHIKQQVRKRMYPIKTAFTWRPYPKANGEDIPAWINGTRQGFATLVNHREKIYALSVYHLVMPTARDLRKEKIQFKDNIKIQMYFGNNPVTLDEWVLDQVEEVAIFKIPESATVKPLTYSIGDSSKLELGDMVFVVAPRDVRIGSVTALYGEEPIRTLELGTPQNTFLTDIPVMHGFSGSPVFAISASTPHIVGLAEGIYIKHRRAPDGRIQEDFQSVMIRINKFKELIEEKFL